MRTFVKAPGTGLLYAIFLVACSSSQTGAPIAGGGTPGSGGHTNGGAGGAPTTGGSSSAGGVGSGGAVASGGSTGPRDAAAGTGGGGPADAQAGGTAAGGSGGSAGSGGKGAGGAAVGGNNAGGTGTAGSAAGGSAAGGSAAGGSAAGGSSGTTSSVEDDGTDCTMGTLPDSGALAANAKLPDPFKKLDGTAMTGKSEWRCRREEIRKLAEKFVYGTKPGKPATVSGTVSSTTITVKVTDSGKSSTFSATVSLPTTGSKPYPAVVVLGGIGADIATIKAAGAAIIDYDPYSVGQEGTGRSSKQGAFYSIYGSTSTTGLLAAWGWGVSRIIDVIEQSDGTILQASAIGVTGCSRFGKGAFVIGVFDQRIVLTMPIESGSGGVPIFRGIPGEGAQSLSSAYGEQPWLGDAFGSFTSNPTKLPVDTHEMVAMVAPRGLFIMDNPFIANLGPKSAHVAALGGAEVYKALGAGDNITYWSDIQDGSHCAIRPEWKDPLTKNIQKFLLKTGSYTGVIKASASATGNLSTWRDWTTPTLN